WLKFVVESYEGLALLRTIDPVSGCVVLMTSPGVEKDLMGLLAALKEEIGLIEGLSDDRLTGAPDHQLFPRRP
ncbi:MAG: DUF4911 domain-containing protein, partial [Pseudomonadota bacterium]